MKLTENGREVWAAAVSLLLLVSGCGFAGYLEEKTSELRVQKETLRKEWQSTLERKKINKPEKEIRDSRARLDVYPSEQGAEQQLEFILDLEREFGNCISFVNCEEPEILWEDRDWCLTGSSVEFSAELSLEEWRRMTDYILASEKKNRILELSFHAEPMRETGDAFFHVYRYGKKEALP